MTRGIIVMKRLWLVSHAWRICGFYGELLGKNVKILCQPFMNDSLVIIKNLISDFQSSFFIFWRGETPLWPVTYVSTNGDRPFSITFKKSFLNIPNFNSLVIIWWTTIWIYQMVVLGNIFIGFWKWMSSAARVDFNWFFFSEHFLNYLITLSFDKTLVFIGLTKFIKCFRCPVFKSEAETSTKLFEIDMTDF